MHLNGDFLQKSQQGASWGRGGEREGPSIFREGEEGE